MSERHDGHDHRSKSLPAHRHLRRASGVSTTVTSTARRPTSRSVAANAVIDKGTNRITTATNFESLT